MKWIFSSLISIFLIGCMSIGDVKPPIDWPKLEIKTVYNDEAVVQHCVQNLLYQSVACATINFDTMTCIQYLPENVRWFDEHEKRHCLGHDHDGDTTLRDYWKNWKRIK